MVRVRFAPSPTGHLHVGGLRTALFNWLFARRHGGKFLLRIEDTDRKRLVEGAVENLVDSLAWAGVAIDEGATVGGDHGPYVQSERLSLYREHVDRLLDEGRAYRCFCTQEDLDRMREEQRLAGQETVMYDRRCRRLAPAEAHSRQEAGEIHVIRMVVPDDETIVVDDIIRGRVEFQTSTVDDQVLMKSDGFPTYHLAAVVDDHLMEITHVVRGEEWLTSTPKHLLLYRAFGWEPPRFAHLPLIVNQERKKLSKRDGDVSVEAYREKGYLPEALVNFLALLGWNAGDDREFYPHRQELIDAFSLERINKSSAVFDLAKLNHINALHLRALDPAEVVERLRPCFKEAGLEMPAPEYVARVFGLMKERVTMLGDLVQQARYFYADPEQYEASAVKKRWKEDSPELLAAYAEKLESLEDWIEAGLEEALRQLSEEEGVGAGKVIHPTRIAISGVGGGPGLFEMMALLGKETCLRRMRIALRRVQKERAPAEAGPR